MRRSSVVVGLLLTAVCLLVSASTPDFLPARLVIDLNTVPIAVDSAPTAACSGAGLAYFQANDANGITGLWKSDGSTSGTTLVEQLGASGGQTFIHCLGVSTNGVAYFLGSDPANGIQLWRSDGVGDNTIALTHFLVSPFTTPALLAFLPNGKVIFEVSEQDHGNELWVSDGTVAGTHILVDLTPGPAGSYVSPGALWGGDYYFGFGGNPWKTDGTAPGTVKIADIGTGAGLIGPYQFAAMTHGVVFAAATQGPGGEIWTTDGTTATRVSDPFPSGNNSVSLQFLQSLGGRVVFQVVEPGTFKNELWTTDATRAGTRQLGASASLTVNAFSASFPGYTVFTGQTGTSGNELWTTDGTDSGTRVLNAAPAGSAVAIGSTFATPINFIYTVPNSSGNYETWITNGTVAGTRNLGDFNPGSLYDNQVFAVADSKATYVLTITGSGAVFGSRAALRRVDGQTGNLSVVTQLDVAAPQSLTMLDGKVMFSNTAPSVGQEPWISDGSAGGTRVLRDIAPSVRNGDSQPLIFAQLGGYAIMGANDGVHGPGLWRSDGTAAGTQMLSSVYPDTFNGIRVPNGMLNGRLLFAGTDAAHGSELWITDGTPAGTKLVKDIASSGVSGTVDSSHPAECGGFATLGNYAYFGARYFPYEGSLWRTDGTDAGTSYIATYRWSRNFSSGDVCVYAQLNGYVYFGAETPPNGDFGMWRTDGNSATGTQVTDPSGVALSTFNAPIVTNGYLYFTASNGTSSSIYRADGTSSTATPIHKFTASETGDGGPYALVAAGKFLFFSGCAAGNVCSLFSVDTTSGQVTSLSTAGGYIGSMLTAFGDKVVYENTSTATGVEPWISDGTPQGTYLLRDIVPGPTDSWPKSFINYNGLMYFTVQQPVTNGTVDEYWRTDGTTAGTVRVDGVSPVPLIYPQSVLGQHLLFAGVDATHGWELWSLDNAQPVLNPDSGSTPADVPITMDVLANDVDSDGAMDPASTRIVQPPAHGTATVVAGTGAIQYTAAAGYVGSDNLTYLAGDSQHYAASAPASVSLTVTAPVGNSGGGSGGGSGSGGSGSGGSGSGSGSGGSGSGSGSGGGGQGSGGSGTGSSGDGGGGDKGGGGGGSIEPFLLLMLVLALTARHAARGSSAWRC